MGASSSSSSTDGGDVVVCPSAFKSIESDRAYILSTNACVPPKRFYTTYKAKILREVLQYIQNYPYRAFDLPLHFLRYVILRLKYESANDINPAIGKTLVKYWAEDAGFPLTSTEHYEADYYSWTIIMREEFEKAATNYDISTMLKIIRGTLLIDFLMYGSHMIFPTPQTALANTYSFKQHRKMAAYDDDDGDESPKDAFHDLYVDDLRAIVAPIIQKYIRDAIEENLSNNSALSPHYRELLGVRRAFLNFEQKEMFPRLQYETDHPMPEEYRPDYQRMNALAYRWLLLDVGQLLTVDRLEQLENAAHGSWRTFLAVYMTGALQKPLEDEAAVLHLGTGFTTMFILHKFIHPQVRAFWLDGQDTAVQKLLRA
jgi:hypothetical protein